MMRAGWALIPTSQRAALLALALLVVLVNIRQPFPAVAPLHHIPTVFLIASAPWWLRRWPLNNAALFCLVGFFALHSFGARWTYSSVPYDQWLAQIVGTDTVRLFGWTRNHYDRLVHFAFGALMVPPLMQWLASWVTATTRQRAIAAVILLLSVSAAYELFEWSLTLFMPLAVAENYNGQQGDMWDAHKDMALALVGSLMSAFWLLRRSLPIPASLHNG